MSKQDGSEAPTHPLDLPLLPHTRPGAHLGFDSGVSIGSSFDAVADFAADVHDGWRSTLEPGNDTAFEPNLLCAGGRIVDIANCDFNELPTTAQSISIVSSRIILGCVHVNFRENEHIDDNKINSAARHLFTLWNYIRNPHGVVDWRTGEAFDKGSERTRTIDRRLIMIGVASILDRDRYPGWDEFFYRDKLMALPGVQEYGARGRAFLESVRQKQQPIPIGSEYDLDGPVTG